MIRVIVGDWKRGIFVSELANGEEKLRTASEDLSSSSPHLFTISELNTK